MGHKYETHSVPYQAGVYFFWCPYETFLSQKEGRVKVKGVRADVNAMNRELLMPKIRGTGFRMRLCLYFSTLEALTATFFLPVVYFAGYNFLTRDNRKRVALDLTVLRKSAGGKENNHTD